MTSVAMRTEAERLALLLSQRGHTIAVAETSAGGRISAALTAVVGSSRWFLGSVVAYSTLSRKTWLGVNDADITEGAVSERAAQLLASAVRSSLGATWGLAETGIAGPQTGRRSSKPTGLAHIAVVGPQAVAVKQVLTNVAERDGNQDLFALEALRLMCMQLEEIDQPKLNNL